MESVQSHHVVVVAELVVGVPHGTVTRKGVPHLTQTTPPREKEGWTERDRQIDRYTEKEKGKE